MGCLFRSCLASWRFIVLQGYCYTFMLLAKSRRSEIRLEIRDLLFQIVGLRGAGSPAVIYDECKTAINYSRIFLKIVVYLIIIDLF